MDHHVIALFALIGMGLDLLGVLFLAYDLFGRRGGPLRTLLRAILYCFIFVAVYSIALDWRFALVGGTSDVSMRLAADDCSDVALLFEAVEHLLEKDALVGGVLIEQDEAAIRFEHDIEATDDADEAQRNIQQRDGSGGSRGP